MVELSGKIKGLGFMKRAAEKKRMAEGKKRKAS